MPVPKQWVIAEPWVIRTLKYPHYIIGKTSSEPMQLGFNLTPRMFRTEASAKAFLAQWRRGTMCQDDDGWVICRHQPHRKDMEFEIIQLQLVRVP